MKESTNFPTTFPLNNTTTYHTLDKHCTDSNTTATPVVCTHNTGPNSSISTLPALKSTTLSCFFPVLTPLTQPRFLQFSVCVLNGPTRLILTIFYWYRIYLWCLALDLALLLGLLLLLWALLLSLFSWFLLDLRLLHLSASWQVSQPLSVLLLVLVQLLLSPPIPLLSLLSYPLLSFLELSSPSLFSFLKLLSPLLLSFFQLLFPLLCFFFFLSPFLLNPLWNQLLMLVVKVDNSLFQFASVSLLVQQIFRVKISRSADFEVQSSKLFTNFVDLLFNLVKALILLVSELRIKIPLIMLFLSVFVLQFGLDHAFVISEAMSNGWGTISSTLMTFHWGLIIVFHVKVR